MAATVSAYDMTVPVHILIPDQQVLIARE
jgi:hypothetical protein